MQHPRFRAGELTTGFIAEEYPEGFQGAPADEQLIARPRRDRGAGRASRRRRAPARISGQLGDADAAARASASCGSAAASIASAFDGFEGGLLAIVDERRGGAS